MARQMCWLSMSGSGEKSLHLRTAPNQPWQSYKGFPGSVPDHGIPGGSKGWATFQKLLREGWTLVPTDQAYVGESASNQQAA